MFNKFEKQKVLNILSCYMASARKFLKRGRGKGMVSDAEVSIYFYIHHSRKSEDEIEHRIVYDLSYTAICPRREEREE